MSFVIISFMRSCCGDNSKQLYDMAGRTVHRVSVRTCKSLVQFFRLEDAR